MAGASLFDCYYSNNSAKPNSALRQLESQNPKREAETVGTVVRELKCSERAKLSSTEYLTPEPSWRLERDRLPGRRLRLLRLLRLRWWRWQRRQRPSHHQTCWRFPGASEMFSVLPFRCHFFFFFFSELLSLPHCVSNCVSELLDPEDAAQFKILKKYIYINKQIGEGGEKKKKKMLGFMKRWRGGRSAEEGG